ncbi:hypothetical protein J3R83DRAFT_10421 [Lanmaoa asiatica]|nr:hypothetical protein J3R83DRAFT_10421 [Lanmaoa asiatica]
MTTAGTGIQVTFPSEQQDVSDLPAEQKVPPPRYRHAAPSAPWPWMDFNQDEAYVPPLSPGALEPWSQYPQSLFGNWTPDQVARCRMLTICKDKYACQIHKVDIFKDGTFDKPQEEVQPRQIPSDLESTTAFWEELQKPPEPNLRVRALFIDNITLNVLRILGSSYNIEPFFFASSANWIPSRYQEDPHHAEGDHITVVLPFIRTVNNLRERVSPTPSNETHYPPGKGSEKWLAPLTGICRVSISKQKILLQDLLAIHMVRGTSANTIISYHHHSELQKTTAKRLQSLVQRTGDSVYWSKIYGKSRDPTFVFLAILWYALYAWDESFEVLYAHLNEQLEAAVATTHLDYTRELHKLQAHLLYYQQLLRDFSKSVEFVRDTPNPAMDEDPDRETSHDLLKQETRNLLSEIDRLEKQRQIQSDRLKNAMALVRLLRYSPAIGFPNECDQSFSTVNIEDSRSMQNLTKATMRDSAAMKQISYLTMIFLPASFLSSVFGMNVREINPGTLETLAAYIESTVILTVITAWVVIALQSHSSFHPGRRSIVKRIAWPVFYGYDLMIKMMAAAKGSLGRRH